MKITHIKQQIKKILFRIKIRVYKPFINKKNASKIKRNVLNSTHSKKVLLSYISSAFNNKNNISNHHTNYYTSYIFAEVLDKLGYVVDVVNWTEKYDSNYDEYEAILGLGDSMENAFLTKNSHTKIIYFATGCNPFFCNRVTIERVMDFYNKHGKYLIESSRFQFKDYPLQHEAADWIILHGNAFAKSTFRNYNIDIISVPVHIYHTPDLENKDWASAKMNYLWFGSSGLIHKGLDLVIDTFVNKNDINLHICGTLESENRFYNYYKPIIEAKSNIFYHGHIDISTDKFKEILNQCAYIIFPSASEGGCAAVITCMANGGLIPITAKSTDVNLDNYGIEINQLSIQGVEDAINKSQKLDISELIKQSKQIIEITSKSNTFECFKKDIYNILKRIL